MNDTAQKTMPTYGTDDEFEARVDRFVRQNVLHCVSNMIGEVAKVDEFSDRVSELFGQSVEITNDNQYYYRVDLDERGQFNATVYEIPGDVVVDDNTDCEDVDDCKAVYTITNDATLTSECTIVLWDDDLNDEYGSPDDKDTVAQVLTDQHGLGEVNMCDPCDVVETWTRDDEVFEHWAITTYFKDKLAAQGEITGGLFDFDIWGRTTTGQSISMDENIRQLVWDQLQDR